jgi:hypothetical protein
MTCLRGTLCAVVLGALALESWAQAPAADQQRVNQQTAVCQFMDGGEVSVRYQAAPVNRDQLPAGQMWSPGEQPMYLFTSTALKAGATEIPTGAYSLYILPEKQHWTLVISKDVSDRKYEPQHDLVRVPMDRGILEEATKNVNLTLGHIAPKECSLRLYYGKTGAWAVFSEQNQLLAGH